MNTTKNQNMTATHLSTLQRDYLAGRRFYRPSAALAFARTLGACTAATPRDARHLLGSIGEIIERAHRVAAHI